MAHPAVTSIAETAHGDNGWLGHFPNDAWVGYYIDTLFLTTFGGIPWQVGRFIHQLIRISKPTPCLVIQRDGTTCVRSDTKRIVIDTKPCITTRLMSVLQLTHEYTYTEIIYGFGNQLSLFYSPLFTM